MATLPQFHANLGFTWRESRVFSTITIDKLLLFPAMSTLLTSDSLGYSFHRCVVYPNPASFPEDLEIASRSKSYFTDPWSFDHTKSKSPPLVMPIMQGRESYCEKRFMLFYRVPVLRTADDVFYESQEVSNFRMAHPPCMILKEHWPEICLACWLLRDKCSYLRRWLFSWKAPQTEASTFKDCNYIGCHILSFSLLRPGGGH